MPPCPNRYFHRAIGRSSQAAHALADLVHRRDLAQASEALTAGGPESASGRKGHLGVEPAVGARSAPGSVRLNDFAVQDGLAEFARIRAGPAVKEVNAAPTNESVIASPALVAGPSPVVRFQHEFGETRFPSQLAARGIEHRRNRSELRWPRDCVISLPGG